MGNEIVHVKPLPDCVQKMVVQLQDNLTRNITDALSGCDSPIEQAFALGLMEMERQYPDVVWSKQDAFEIYGRKYRTDFVLETYGVVFAGGKMPVYDWTTRLVVECDGLKYHSDKEQIEHDNLRDIDFLMKYGMPTIRFTGSEILKSPYNCAGRAMQLVMTMHSRTRCMLEETLQQAVKTIREAVAE